MAKLPEEYNFGGDSKEIEINDLIVQLKDMYRDIAIAVNKKPDVYERTTDGMATDTSLPNGAININTTTSKVEMLTQHTTTENVTWKTLS